MTRSDLALLITDSGLETFYLAPEQMPSLEEFTLV